MKAYKKCDNNEEKNVDKGTEEYSETNKGKRTDKKYLALKLKRE